MSCTISETIICHREDGCTCELHQALRERGEAQRAWEQAEAAHNKALRERDEALGYGERAAAIAEQALRERDEARADAEKHRAHFGAQARAATEAAQRANERERERDEARKELRDRPWRDSSIEERNAYIRERDKARELLGRWLTRFNACTLEDSPETFAEIASDTRELLRD